MPPEVRDPLLLAALGVALLPGAWIAARRGEGETSTPRARDAVALLLAAAAYAIGHFVVADTPSWGPWEHQPLWAAGAAVAAGLPFIILRPACAGARAIASLVTAAALGAIVVEPAAEAEWSAAAARWLALIGLPVIAAALLYSVTALAARRPGAAAPLAVAVAGVGASILSLQSHYSKFALLAAVVPLALGPSVAALLWRRHRRASQGAVLVGATLVIAILLGGWLHSLAEDRVHWAAFAAVGLALVLPWLGELPIIARSGKARAAAHGAGAVLPIVAAVSIGLLTSPGDEGESDDVPPEWVEGWEEG